MISTSRPFAGLSDDSALGTDKASAHYSCPTKTSALKSDGSTPVEWTVHNPGRLSMHLFWVTFEGEEQVMETISGSDQIVVNTYAGHAWRVRSPQGVLVAEALASSETLTLQDCSEMYGDDAAVLNRPTAQLLAKFQPRVEAHWQGTALSSTLRGCDPWRFLSSEATFIGFHVLCLLSGAGSALDAVAVFVDGLRSEDPVAIVALGPAQDFDDLLLLLYPLTVKTGLERDLHFAGTCGGASSTPWQVLEPGDHTCVRSLRRGCLSRGRAAARCWRPL